MLKLFSASATTFLLAAMIASCTPEGDLTTYDCSSTAPTYTAIIKPVLDAKCATSGCHNASSAKSGFDLSTYATCKTASEDAAFRGAIQHISGFSNMPRGGDKLDEPTVKIISCWVQNGAPE